MNNILFSLVGAISLSEFASKSDEIFRCKKHTILRQLVVIYICNKRNQDTSQHASTNNITGMHHNNLRPQMEVHPVSYFIL